jgi:hypothetical protein
MSDVKRKHQEKIVEQKIREQKEKEEFEYVTLILEKKKSDWRKELNEMMTTADVFYTTLPATGDVNLAFPDWNILAGQGYSVSGGTVTINGDDGATGLGNGIVASFDLSIYDNVVFDVNIIGDEILGVFGSSPSPILVVVSSGTYSVSLQNDLIFAVPLSGSVQISNLRYQRRTPMNVFVPLSSPEATSFIRTDPMMSKLSPQERLKKLKEMLEASDEYVEKILGSNFPGTGAVPPGEAGDTPGVQVTDYGSDLTPLSKTPYGTGEVGQIAQVTPSASGGGRMPYGTPGADKPFRIRGYRDDSGKIIDFDDPTTWPTIKTQVKGV